MIGKAAGLPAATNPLPPYPFRCQGLTCAKLADSLVESTTDENSPFGRGVILLARKAQRNVE